MSLRNAPLSYRVFGTTVLVTLGLGEDASQIRGTRLLAGLVGLDVPVARDRRQHHEECKCR